MTGDDIRQTMFRPALGGYRFRDVDEMLDLFADALDQGLPSDVVTPTVHLHKSLRGYNVSDVERLLESLDLGFRPLARRPWSPTAFERAGPSAEDVTRLILRERGVTIGRDAARRVAEHLLGATSVGEHRAVEIEGRQEHGEPSSVVITTRELDEAMSSLHVSAR